MIFNHFKWDFNKIKWEIHGFLDMFEYFVQIPDFRIFNTVQNETLSFSWFQIDPNEPEYLENDF